MEWEWPKGWCVGPRKINDSMWFWFESGGGEAWLNRPSEMFPIGVGDLLLIPQGVQHMVRALPNTEVHVYAVHFCATIFHGINLLDVIGFPALLRRRPKSPHGDISKTLAREFAVKAPGWHLSMIHHIHRMLLDAIRYEGKNFRMEENLSTNPNFTRLFPVIQCIDEHIGDSTLSVCHLAGMVCLSETHFRRVFQEVFGMSPVKFLRKRRIDHACTLLRTTDLPIKEVAQACGFSDTSFFSRVFHNIAGATPANYRHMDVV